MHRCSYIALRRVTDTDAKPKGELLGAYLSASENIRKKIILLCITDFHSLFFSKFKILILVIFICLRVNTYFHSIRFKRYANERKAKLHVGIALLIEKIAKLRWWNNQCIGNNNDFTCHDTI